MERITAAASARRPQRAAGALVACALLFAAGCGSTSDYKNQPRMPSPIVLGTSIDASRVSVSPTRIGAGPVLLVITNQSPAARSVTLQSDAVPQTSSPRGNCHLDQSSPFFCQSTSPISPQGTAQLAGVLREGRYRVQVDDSGVHAAELVVGPPRPSAQNDVLQP